MTLCAGIKADGGRCGAQAMRNSQWCINHDPDKAEARRRRASKGGKRGGRGRPSVELARLQARFENLAENVLAGQPGSANGGRGTSAPRMRLASELGSTLAP
jgi:hypothetical protein